MATGRKYPLDVVITAVDRLTGPLTRINSTINRVTAPTRRLSNAVSSLSQTAGLANVTAGLQGVYQAAGNVSSAISTATGRVLRLGVVAGGLGYLFKRQFIDTASTFENLEVSLEGIEGSAAAAKRSMAFIKDLTVKTPFEMKDIAGTFRLLRAQGLDPMDGTLQSIVDQVAKVGGTGDKLTGIAMQLGQAWSKGRLGAQDMNILAENGIAVWATLARGVARVEHGVESVSEKQLEAMVAKLRKMSEEGELGLDKIRILIQQMGRESEGASKRMMGTFSGLLSNLKDKWTFFRQDVMKTGAFERIKDILRQWNERIDRMAANGALQRWAERVGAKLESGFRWLEANGPRILTETTEFLGNLWKKADAIATTLGGWGNVVKFGIAAYIAGPLLSSVASLTLAVIALNGALAATPAGWLLLGGAALVGGGAFLLTQMKPVGPREPEPQRLVDRLQFLPPDVGKGDSARRDPRLAPDAPHRLLSLSDDETAQVQAAISAANTTAKALRERPLPVTSKTAPIAPGRNRHASFPQFSGGSGGLRDFGRSTTVQLHGEEEVLTRRGANSVAALVARVLAPWREVSAMRLSARPAALPMRRNPTVVTERQVQNAHVKVEFANAPPGTRARVQPGSTADVDLSTRVLMGPTTAGAW